MDRLINLSTVIMQRYILYARKSSESEDRQVLSIESQISELQDLATKNNLHIEYVLSESRSAKAPGRPVFSKLLKLLEKGNADAILCWKLDRLARNARDGGDVIYALDTGDLKNITTPAQSFDNSSNDKFWMQLEFGMAKKYVDDLPLHSNHWMTRANWHRTKLRAFSVSALMCLLSCRKNRPT